MMAGLWTRLRPLALFAVSGVLALFIDIGVLYVLKPAWGLYGARACSFWCAATFTWWFNRSITFRGPKPVGIVREYLSYLSSMLAGGAINYGAYALSVQQIEVVRAHPALGVALGSLCGLAFNFWSARRIMEAKA